MRGVSILLGPCAAVLLSSAPATAATFPGTSFTHHDWELACDNTGTCRAAGYSVDGAELPISLLLTRKAGANQPVTGEVMLGEYGDNPVLDALPGALRLTLQIGRHVARGGQPQQADISGLVIGGILAGRLAQRGGARGAIEDVVDDLEQQADALAIMVQPLQLRVVQIPRQGAQQHRRTDEGAGLVNVHELQFFARELATDRCQVDGLSAHHAA